MIFSDEAPPDIKRGQTFRIRLALGGLSEAVLLPRGGFYQQTGGNYSLARFESGDITSQDLGIEQERLAQSRLEYLDAYITYQLALADLKRKTLWDFRTNRSYLISSGIEDN